MTRRRLPMRAIAWAERYLPVPATPGRAPDAKARRGWTVVAIMVPITVVNLIGVVRHRSDVAAAWPSWRPVVLDLTLVVAGAVLVTAVVAGVVAWRQAKRHA